MTCSHQMNKKLAWIVLGLIATFARSPHALALTIEDTGLAAVSDEISSVVYKDKSFESFKDYSCKIVGEKIALSVSPAVETYFLTTTDACGWGAALGPIWLVRTFGGTDSLALSAGGYTIYPMKIAKNGMRNVKIGSGSAKHPEFTIYEFDGRVYKKFNRN